MRRATPNPGKASRSDSGAFWPRSALRPYGDKGLNRSVGAELNRTPKATLGPHGGAVRSGPPKTD